jgi:hypothetical protein
MAEERSGYKHDASDKKLDQAAEAAKEAEKATDSHRASGPGHDVDKIRSHDVVGKDRLFETREHHHAAQMESENKRLARDVARHDHAVDDDEGEGEPGASKKKKG